MDLGNRTDAGTRRFASVVPCGFTLLELIIVLGLMVVLFAIFGSHFTKGARQREVTQCQYNLQKIYLALSIYSSDNKGQFPRVANPPGSEAPLSLLVPRSTTTTEIFTCPGSHDKKLAEGEPFASGRISYAYYMGWTSNDDSGAILASDRQIDTLPKATGAQTFSLDGKSPGDNHDKYGGNLLFLNGETISIHAKTTRNLVFPTNVTLLNPRP